VRNYAKQLMILLFVFKCVLGFGDFGVGVGAVGLLQELNLCLKNKKT
jgi:hypothetical protein